MFNLPNIKTIFGTAKDKLSARKKNFIKKELFDHKKDNYAQQEKPKIKEVRSIKVSNFTEASGRVIKSPLITEKTNLLKENDKYVFKVSDDASKSEIIKAIKELYKVKINNINVLKTFGKKIRRGKVISWKPGYKKAIVTLAKGEKINIAF